MPPLYNDYGTWLRHQFPFRVQKIAIDAGFSCPNRDGRISAGGCIFCNNQSFNPSYCHRHQSITEQLEAGKDFFCRKYPDMKYLAYFQAYSNTYAPINTLRQRYEEALRCPDVVGLVIATRPDCINPAILDLLEELNRKTFLIVEYGIESANDQTLQRINRGHTFADSQCAIIATAERGILIGAHVILGLPGESPNESLRQASLISQLPLHMLKIHQLQIIRSTPLALEYERHPFPLYTVDEYIQLVTTYLEHLRPTIVVERFVSQSPPALTLAPHWGLKNHEFTDRLLHHLTKEKTWQGRLYRP